MAKQEFPTTTTANTVSIQQETLEEKIKRLEAMLGERDRVNMEAEERAEKAIAKARIAEDKLIEAAKQEQESKAVAEFVGSRTVTKQEKNADINDVILSLALSYNTTQNKLVSRPAWTANPIALDAETKHVAYRSTEKLCLALSKFGFKVMPVDHDPGDVQ